MSLIVCLKEKDKILCMSDSASFAPKYNCVMPIATKIYLYESNIVIQHCGLGTIAGRMLEEHIKLFAINNQKLSIHEVPQALLKYFEQYNTCSEMMQYGNKDIIFLISGWDNHNQIVYSVHTETQDIKLEEDNLVAYGMEVPNLKKQFDSLKKQFPDFSNIIVLKLSFTMITAALKISVLFEPDTSITLDKIKEATQMPEFKEFDAKICEPYDYIELLKDNTNKINITLDKEKKWLSE